MSNYLKQEHDFVERTLEIIEQYGKINLDTKYEVTLFLNCLTGLIILPHQHWFKLLPTEEISEEKWGIGKHDINLIKPKNDLTVSNLSRRIRNSISHYNFEVFGDSDDNIEKIRFCDYSGSNITFDCTITIDQLKTFAEAISKEFILQMKKHNES